MSNVYSDKNALLFFNSDNCHGDNFYYSNEDRMRQAIEFWFSSYSKEWFVRWTIIDKEKHKAIGTIEAMKRMGFEQSSKLLVGTIDGYAYKDYWVISHNMFDIKLVEC